MSAAIRQALEVLSAPGQIIELRIPRARHTRSGYFDDLDRAAEAAAKLNGTASVYMTLNPCNPALLARGVNRIVEYPEATTSDRDILRRVWFPIDLDPVRPAGVSSTEAEHEAAIARAREVFGYLRSEGWPKPLVADSGNGAHLLYRIALPNDAESAGLLKRCLQALALRFGDDLVSVDEKVFNAARIWKVYGTIACKGDNTPERPHRQAKLLQVPDELEVVSFDKLIALARTAPKPSQGDARYSGGERFDLDRWISDHGLDVAGPIEWSGGRKWIFRVCPWNEEHRNRSAYIVQFSSGAIAAGCHHNGCNGKGWAALRAMYEPEYREAEHRGPARADHGPGGGTSNGSSPGDLDGGEEWPAPPPQVTSYPPIPPLAALRIDPADLDTARITPQCVVESYLYADVAAFPGPGGTGKTTLFLFEGVHIVLGEPLYGLKVLTSGVVVLVTAEDRRELLTARLRRLMEALELDDQERARVCAGVMIWDVTGTVCRLTELDRHGNVVLTGLADAIVERFQDAPPVMVGLDPVISFGAGERIVNDNEHSLILAARRIVRGLGCCVRLICHTGKQGARDGVIDQYAARGGSALADGARMVTVLRAWDADAKKDKLSPPPGLSFGADEQVIVLARPKLSYDSPQPQIWLKRRGYAFEHFIATRLDPEAEARARVDQIERYLIAQLASGSRHSKKTLEDTGVMPQTKLRAALASLMAAGRLIYAELPAELRHGGRKDYLHPVAATSLGDEAGRDEVGRKSAPTSSGPEPSSTSSWPYRKKVGDEVEVTDFSLPAYHFVNEGQRGSDEVNEVNEVADGKAEERETGRL